MAQTAHRSDTKPIPVKLHLSSALDPDQLHLTFSPPPDPALGHAAVLRDVPFFPTTVLRNPQVLAARHLCLTALTTSTNHHNCYAMYRFASETAIAPLRDAAERCCLAALPQMAAAWGAQQQLLVQKQQGHVHGQLQEVQQGSSSGEQVLNSGFAQLPQRQLEALLQSDALQVGRKLREAGWIW